MTLLTRSLNYKIIYLNKNSIFRANCNIDKVTWEPFLNSFVKLPTFLVDKLNNTQYYDLFLLNNGVVDVTIQQNQTAKSSSTASESGLSSTPSTLHDLTSAQPRPVGIITINQTLVRSVQNTQPLNSLTTQPAN